MKELIESKWEEILSLLETEYDISHILINTWIRPLKIYEIKNKTVYFYIDEKLGESAVKFIHRKEFDLFLLSSIREVLNDIDIEIILCRHIRNCKTCCVGMLITITYNESIKCILRIQVTSAYCLLI